MFQRSAVQGMHARLAEVAEGLGVPFSPRMHAPNTKKALAISELARRQGKLDGWREAAMDAHWFHGRDLEDEAVLRDLAEQVALDPDDVIAFLDTPEVPGLLQAQRIEAYRWGVSGIPTWFMLPAGWTPGEPWDEDGPRPVRVVGCQPLEVVEQAARMAGATPRSLPQAPGEG